MSETAPTQPFYQAGGTLPPGWFSYVERPADDELLRRTLGSEFCYVLTPRQTGKSSLMVRTARHLREKGVHTAIIDLTSIGTVPADQWYLSLLTLLKNGLQLSVDVEVWWRQRDSLSPVQRFTAFLREVILGQISGQVVIFLDEIDSTLNLDFRDDFFAAIRSIYNARADIPAFKRLTFVLLGVAAPNDLIRDPQRTPFNIGKAIDLFDFSAKDAQILRQGLDRVYPDKSGTVFDRIFYWTGGHPYLTQMLCASMRDVPPEWWNADGVDSHVYKLLISGAPHSDINLQTVQDSIIKSPQRGRLLSLYKKICKSQRVRQDERSPDQNYLKLFGLARAHDGLLQVRNEIYRRAFDEKWISKNTPKNRTRWTGPVMAAVAVALIAITLITLVTPAAGWIEGGFLRFRFGTVSSQDRFGILARLLEMGQDQAAREAFSSLSQDDKLALFKLPVAQVAGQSLVRVVSGLYAEIPNDAGGNALLSEMDVPLSRLDDPAARLFHNEIKLWLAGRESYNNGAYAQAAASYSSAILDFNSRNPGIYLDRALAYVRLNQSEFALTDLLTALTLNPSQVWRDRVRQVLQDNSALVQVVRGQRDRYPALAPLAP